jgi:hypothetical protein
MQNRIALAVILTAGLLSTPVFAQSQEEQQLCMNDAFRVCQHTIPDRGRTFACMVQNKSQLSAGCQGVMEKYASAGSSVQTASAPPPRMTQAPVRMSTPVKPVRTATNGRPGKPLNILMR